MITLTSPIPDYYHYPIPGSSLCTSCPPWFLIVITLTSLIPDCTSPTSLVPDCVIPISLVPDCVTIPSLLPHCAHPHLPGS